MISITKYLKTAIFNTLWALLLFPAVVGAQCIDDGHQSDRTVNNGSGSMLNPNFSTDVVIGQPVVSGQIYSYSGADRYISSGGFWTYMYHAPIIANVEASDGVHEDRIGISWSINRNTPAVTGGFKIYRDGFVIGTVSSTEFSFIDFNVIPGVYYSYGVSGINTKGEGHQKEDLGYVNPNGVISGRVTTFSGSSVKDGIVSLLPSNNLSLNFAASGGLFVDTIEGNAAPLTDSIFTLSLWAKIKGFASEGMLFDYGKADDVNFWMGVESDTSVYIAMATTGGVKKASYQIAFPYSPNWHHFAGVYNGRDLMLFYDGSMVSAVTVDINTTKYANHRMGIASTFNSNLSTNKYNGYIDEVRVLDRAQRPAEIKKFMGYTVPVNYDGLVAYWKMDEGKGDKVIDLVQPQRVSTICNGYFDANDESGVKIAGITNASGYYVIEGVNYSSGTSFQVIPAKFVSYNTALEFNDIESNYAVTSKFRISNNSTIEMWVNPYSYNGTQYILSSNGTTPFDLFLDGNDLKLTIRTETNIVASLSGVGYKYINISRSGGDVTVTINDDQASAYNGTYGTTFSIADTTYDIGRKSGGTDYYSGLIDGLVVWNKLLTPPEASAHFNFGIHSITTLEDGLEIVNPDLEAFIHLNDQEGNLIVNEIAKEGVLEFGSVHGAQFVEDVAHDLGIEHEFEPNSRIVTLNNSNTSADGIDFKDITTVPVTGIVKYEGSNCYIEYAEILLDGEATSPPTFSQTDGSWTLELEPGVDAQLSARFQEHEMSPFPIFQLYNVVTPKAGIAFLDQELRTVSGMVAGGTCEMPIIELGKTMSLRLAATDGCYSDTIVLTGSSTTDFEFTDVPPGEYTVGITHSSGNSFGIGKYFADLGGITIDVLSENASNLNFIYRSSHNLEVSQLDTNDCGNTVLKQGLPKSIVIKVYENYLDQKCYLDTADITISDGIGQSTDIEFTGNHEMTTGDFTYSFFPGEANIVSPYTKSLQVIAKVEGSPVSEIINAVVLGKRKRAATFTTKSPALPLTVLRDPPGDQSYAYMEEDQEVCMSDIELFFGGGKISQSQTAHLGPLLTTSLGLPGATTDVEVDVTADVKIETSLSSEGSVETEISNCVTLGSILQTTALGEDTEGNFIIGEDADIYVGAALNLTYGLTDVLVYDGSDCSNPYNLIVEFTIDPEDFETFYVYSGYHLKNDVIPSLLQLANAPGLSADSVAIFTQSALTWQSFLDLNSSRKQSAQFNENRSFDAGAVYTGFETIETSTTTTTDFSITLDGSVSGEAGVQVNGLGATLTAEIELTIGYGGTSTSGVTATKTVGYVLADDDLGDNFSVNIYKDKTYGTPVFKLVAGESSCPHEENTLPRQGVQILVNGAKNVSEVNVSTDASAVYDLYLGNLSQSDEAMTYAIDVVNASNPLGAIVSINGNVLGESTGGNGLAYTLEPNEGQLATLALERGADPNIFEYDSIQVIFKSTCDDQITDTVTISAHFVEPCSSVSFGAPGADWYVLPGDSGTKAIVLEGYDKSDTDLDLIRVQYRGIGSAIWINIEDVLTADLGPTETQVDWSIGTLQDGDYEIRALSQCAGGLPAGYSDAIPGIIEQKSPEILGVPQPADGILNSGDEISITFTEEIDCDKVFQADQNGLNSIGIYNLTTDKLINANIQCIDDKISLVPLIPSIYMENNTLEVRITGIEDLVGNVLEKDNTGSLIHKWDFYVNVSPVSWVGAEVEELMIKEADHSFDRVIENTGGNNVQYSIAVFDSTDLPSCKTVETANPVHYIVASTSSGSLNASGEKTITFTVDPQLAVGEYTGVISLRSSYGCENIPYVIRVMCESPSWNANPSQFTFNMNYTVAVDVNGYQSTDSYDMIAGYIDGEIRGVAHVQYIEAIDNHLAFLSVYGNADDNGKEVTFKVWDASQCKLYDRTHETFPFAANGQIGTPINEDTIHTMDLLAQTIHLNEGWNWISFNLELDNDSTADVMSSIGNPTDGLIKSQTQFSQYYPTANSWVGGLQSITEYEMYQVKVEANDSIEFYGRPIHVDSTEILLVAGWNWISYIPQGGMSPGWAFQTLEPYDGDIVKNQYFFAQFVAGYGWIGNLSYMDAPSGYLYKSSTIDTLTYPIDATTIVIKSAGLEMKQMDQKKSLFDEFDDINVSPNQFRTNMNIVGIGMCNDTIITETDDKVFAYIDGEVRGVASSMQVGTQDEPMFFISVYGNTEDFNKTVEFKYLDESTQKLYAVEEELEFVENDVVGLVTAQKHLTLSGVEATTVREIAALTVNTLSVYPNPINHNTVVSIYSNAKQDAVLSVMDNIGRVLASRSMNLTSGKTEIKLNELISGEQQATSKGMYHISLVIDNEVHSVTLINE
ncbi:MAG: T9SS type A sorting domain-containing protein [Flavobacteriales bacterium]|nr:T9SS type A sorting domain-containing protein [Flavobacteriales bacterium]